MAYSLGIRSQALALYGAGAFGFEVAKELGVPAKTVEYWARKAGIARTKSAAVLLTYAKGIRTPEKQRAAHLKYTLNESAFEGVVTPALAWALGVIAGDGCIVRHKGVLRAVSVLGDEDVCQKIAALLGSNAPVHDLRDAKRPARTHEVRFHSPRLAVSLERFGIVPDKSHVLQWPALSEDLASHFIRGLWDSDGSVTHNFSSVGTKYLVLSLRMCAGELLEAVRVRVEQVCGSQAQVTPDSDGTFILSVSSQQAEKLGHWLWKDSTPGSRGARKYRLFGELVGVSRAKAQANKAEWDEVRAATLKLYAEGLLPREVAEKLQLNKKTVERWLLQAGAGRGKSENQKLAWQRVRRVA